MTGALHLIGGGRATGVAIWAAFLGDAARSAPPERRDAPRIAVLIVGEGDRDRVAARFVEALGTAGACVPVVSATAHAEAIDPGVLDDVDGVLVGGGLTPAYLDALLPLRARIRHLVAGGVPYAGFSAGAAIAAQRALPGGWLLDGVPVVDQQVAEDLDPVTVHDGLCLTPLTVDVHAAQWGSLARLIAAVCAGLVTRGAAIDEETSLVLRGSHHSILGRGSVWWVEPAADGAVTVRRTPASS